MKRTLKLSNGLGVGDKCICDYQGHFGVIPEPVEIIEIRKYSLYEEEYNNVTIKSLVTGDLYDVPQFYVELYEKMDSHINEMEKRISNLRKFF